jgi:3'-phosphoadenosine 5'-phosphosulfate sulfotransferase (PAPS reductase)/FAD synthetase
VDETWRRTFLDWSRQGRYRALVAETLAAIRSDLEGATAFVSFSGGKDSTVLTHLVMRVDPNTLVLHWDYGPYFVPRPLHERILANARALGVRRLRVETSDEYLRLGRKARNVLGRALVGRLLPRLAREGYTLSFVGLREEESLKRRRRIRSGAALSELRESWPIAKWRWLDVWAYIVEHDLPYLAELYDPAAAIIGWDRARWTTLHDPEFAHIAQSMDGVLHWRWRYAGPDEVP